MSFLSMLFFPSRRKHALRHVSTLALALTACLCTAACEPTVATRGNILDPDKLAEIKVNSSTREDVATKLGTPTQIGTFDEKTWYYIGRKTEQYSFFDPEVTEQKAVAIHFNDQGTVTGIDPLDLSTAQNITPADGETPTYGRDDTFIRQLLGNLAHPTPLSTKHTGQ